jgi:hypothetical protein
VAIDGDHFAHLFEPLCALGAEIGSRVDVETIPGAANGYYEPASRRIAVAAVSSSFSANAQVRTLVRELSHALVRVDRHDDDPQLSSSRPSRTASTRASASTSPATRSCTSRPGPAALMAPPRSSTTHA